MNLSGLLSDTHSRNGFLVCLISLKRLCTFCVIQNDKDYVLNFNLNKIIRRAKTHAGVYIIHFDNPPHTTPKQNTTFNFFTPEKATAGGGATEDSLANF